MSDRCKGVLGALVLLAGAGVAFAQGRSECDLTALKAAWQDRTALRAEVSITHYLPDGSGGRKQVGTRDLSVLRSYPMWKMTWQNAADKRVDVRAYSGERGWDFSGDDDELAARILKPGEETFPNDLSNYSDPYRAAFAVWERPLWEFTFGEPVKGEIEVEANSYFSYKRKPLLERVRLTVPSEANEPKLTGYDIIVWEFDFPTYAIRLTPGTRDSIEEIAQLQGKDRIKGRLSVSRRDGATGLPLEWTYDQLTDDGQWLQGYVAKVESYDLRPNLTPADFAPGFPPGTRVEDELLTSVGIWATERTRDAVVNRVTADALTPAGDVIGEETPPSIPADTSTDASVAASKRELPEIGRVQRHWGVYVLAAAAVLAIAAFAIYRRRGARE